MPDAMAVASAIPATGPGYGASPQQLTVASDSRAHALEWPTEMAAAGITEAFGPGDSAAIGVEADGRIVVDAGLGDVGPGDATLA